MLLPELMKVTTGCTLELSLQRKSHLLLLNNSLVELDALAQFHLTLAITVTVSAIIVVAVINRLPNVHAMVAITTELLQQWWLLLTIQFRERSGEGATTHP